LARDGITITAPAVTVNAIGLVTITGADVSITPLEGGTF